MTTAQFDLPAIIKRCKQMDRLSQQLLFEKLYDCGHLISMRYTHNKTEADEVLSNAFLKVFRNIEKYNEEYDFLPWFKKIVINTAIDYIRKTKKEIRAVELNIEINDVVAEDFEIDVSTDILALMQKLPTMYLAVFNLYIIEEYSHDEIGLLLGISPSTSRSNLTRAKSLLKKIILSQTSPINSPSLRKFKID